VASEGVAQEPEQADAPDSTELGLDPAAAPGLEAESSAAPTAELAVAASDVAASEAGA
jgi:hypothetical protein